MDNNEVSIAQALLAAPGWARVGLTAPVVGLRRDAARELARAVLEGRQVPKASPDQLVLSL